MKVSILLLVLALAGCFPDGFDPNARFGPCTPDVERARAFNAGVCGICECGEGVCAWLPLEPCAE